MSMPLLRFLYRKMWNTRWLTLCTLLGLIMAVSFTTSIPMYADGSLKRVVEKSLAEKSDGLPAGSLLIRYQASGNDKTDLDDLHNVDQFIAEQLPKEIDFPQLTYSRSMTVRAGQLSPVDPSKVDPSKRRQMTLTANLELPEHANIVQGKMFADQPVGGVIEAVVLEEGMYRNDLHIGDEFNYPLNSAMGQPPLKVKIVGAFAPKEDQPAYWFQGVESLTNALFVDDKVMTEELYGKQKMPVSLVNWYYAFDLRDITSSGLGPLERKLDRLDITLYQKLKNTRIDVSFLPLLSEFRQQSVQLQILLFTLAAPMIAMVFYYIMMNARQSLERQQVDISVLRSRGGSTRQIIWIYLLEGLILGAVALIAGPLIGWFMAKSIGSASGFLSFVDRKSIPVVFSLNSLLYGVAAVAVAIAAGVIPAVMYAKSSIVAFKQKLARADKAPVWQRWFLDIVLLALAGYGWYAFDQRQFLSAQTGLTSDQLQVQPLLFFVPALSIFALGLFFLRVFPWLLKLFGWIGRRLFSVPVYLTLTQLSRSAKSYYPLMLLLILTLGLGVYNSSAARTIDLNSTERVLYEYGTDVIVQTAWESRSDALPPIDTGEDAGQDGADAGASGASGGTGAGAGAAGGTTGAGTGTGAGAGGAPTDGAPPPPQQVRYVEPPFELFRTLPGVQDAARVLRTKGNVVISGRSVGQGMVMGIDNVDFAKVAWFRNDLFPVHPYQYLNLLGSYEQAVLVPTNFAEKYHLKTGDLINISLQQQSVEFVVVGILPYWPSEYPAQAPFFITNLDYIYDQSPVQPYDVWLKMKDGALVTPVVEKLQAQNIQLVSVKDVRNELIRQQKQPSRGGVFGILSLGFLVSAMISLIGYVLYWFFNLSSRVVQFGVLRAMGLTRRQLTWMLLMEQGFTAGLSIVLGVVLGKATCYLFLPFLQTSENVQTQVPPFHVVFEASDTDKLYFVVAFMMLTGAVLLMNHIRKLRVHQAVKLGEER
jgi:putative ABC transport system permease protein